MLTLTVFSCLLSAALCLSHDNFCRPLEDYGPRSDGMEERQVCHTNFVKNCEPVEVQDCLQITELRCELELFTNCSMDWQMKESVESLMSVKTKDLKNCTKEMVVEYHDKTIYDCRNVTKRHCTTLWTINEEGQKVWAGNEDDCRDVTWEECSPVEKKVPMAVAQMVCQDTPVSYFDYENTTTLQMADTMDCTVEKRPVCEPVTSKKCAETSYTRCEEVPETVCSVVEIPVPSQAKLHKQWCLFDQREGDIDFDREVRKIAGRVEEQLAREEEQLAREEEDNSVDVRSVEEDRSLQGRPVPLLSQLTLLDVQSPHKRQLEPIFEDLPRLQVKDFARAMRSESGSRRNKSGRRPAARNKRKGKVTNSREHTVTFSSSQTRTA